MFDKQLFLKIEFNTEIKKVTKLYHVLFDIPLIMKFICLLKLASVLGKTLGKFDHDFLARLKSFDWLLVLRGYSHEFKLEDSKFQSENLKTTFWRFEISKSITYPSKILVSTKL